MLKSNLFLCGWYKKSVFLGLFLLAGVMLTGCSASEKVKLTDCKTDNLLRNAEFLIKEDSEGYGWVAAQHVGEKSFLTEVANGVLTIKKIATQPWFTYQQYFNDLESYIQKDIVFSAELKLDLNDEVNHAFKVGGGLNLRVTGDPDFLGNDKVLYASFMEHEPRLGKTDWMSVSVRFTMPEKATRLVVGFVHQANGEMSIRNPYLGVCD